MSWDALMSHLGTQGGSSVSWRHPDVPYGDTERVLPTLGTTPHPLWGRWEGPCLRGTLMSHVGAAGGSLRVLGTP